MLALKRDEVIDQRTGTSDTFPKPQGMSRGSVWWAYRPEDITRGWEPSFPRLVGIQCAAYEGVGLKFAPIQHALGIIAGALPELEASLRVTAPPRL